MRISPVPITAYACVTACGHGTEALHTALRSNRSALTDPTTLELEFSTYVGEVRGTLPEIEGDLIEFRTRNSRLGLAALYEESDGLFEAVSSAKARYGAERIGVVLGTSTSGLFETESAYAYFLREQKMPRDFHFLTRHAYQASGRLLQRELALTGPCIAVSTACSSSAKALACGQRLINTGVCDAVVVGGVDTLCGLTLRGFHSLELISAAPCKPMDAHRCGINIGEAAGLLLLEKSAPTWDNYPHLLAVGESSDAYHMSSPHPEGLGARMAMQRALQLAGCMPTDVDYVNFHATATIINDKVEAKAVGDTFSDRVPCSGTKGITGHTLGAAGAIETIISLLALKHSFIPGTCGLERLDPELQCQVVDSPRQDCQIRTVMSNAFGFGGNNTSVIVAYV